MDYMATSWQSSVLILRMQLCSRGSHMYMRRLSVLCNTVQEAQVYRQATIDQEGSTHSPLFFWDNTFPGVELLLSQLDASNSAHASTVRPYAPCAICTFRHHTHALWAQTSGALTAFGPVLLGKHVSRC